jgi:acyl-coenzyme A synthetase/AMP-(fatty) acid ligase
MTAGEHDSVVDAGRPPIAPARFNLAEHVLTAGSATPAATALEVIGPTGTPPEVWSYACLIAAVRGAGRWLLDLGLSPGDRVLIRLDNRVEFPVLYLGAIAAGMVAVPMSPALTVPEITALAAEVRPALVVSAPGVALPEGAWRQVSQDLAAWERLPACDWHRGTPEREAYVVFTSGTSGRPNGIRHAHRAILGRAMMHEGWEGLTPSDRLLHTGAFSWTYTMGTGLMDPWSNGATALILSGPMGPGDLPEVLLRHRVTILATAPGVLRQILAATSPDDWPALPHLRHALVAGDSLPDPLRRGWQAVTGRDVHVALGMSEVSTYLSSSPARPAPPGTTGYAQPGRRIAVLDQSGSPVPRGEPGILAVDCRDPGLMLGTLRGPVPLTEDGWFVTGDRALMADDGAITSLGRGDDLMNPGGYRVAPQEVEAALAGFPGLEDLAVTDPEVKPGVRVIACLYVAKLLLDETALNAYAGARLARWKQPRLWRRVAALPRTANHKLDRKALRRLIEESP